MSVVVREAHEHTPESPLRRIPGRRFILSNVAVAVVATGVYFLLHFLLELGSQHVTWLYFARLMGPAAARRIVGSLWPDVLVGLIVFVGVELSAIALSARGRTPVFWTPALIWVLTPAFVGDVGPVGRLPAVLGPGWRPPVAMALRQAHIARWIWAGAVVDLGLALLPALVIAIRAHRQRVLSSRPIEPVLYLAALSLSVYVLWLVLSTRATAFDARFPWREVPTFVPVFLFGLLLGASRRAWPWLWTIAAVPVLLMTSWYEVFLCCEPLRTTLASSVPWVGLTVAGVAPGPTARLLQTVRDRRILLVVSVNLLNVADAVLTSFEVRHTGVVETNPVIGAIGLPAKVLLVATITLLLARRRPRALVWPALALLGVLGWHIAGLYLNAHVP